MQVHEALFLALGLILLLALTVHCGVARDSTLVAAAATAGYASVLFLSQKGSRTRLLACAMVTWLLYVGSSDIIEALQLPVHSAQILAWDTWLLGGTPSVSWQGALSPWMVGVLSAAYLSYQVYVHWAFLSAWRLSTAERMEFTRCVFTTFVVGFSGYFLFPAATPAAAFPELFAAPLGGGAVTAFNEMLNGSIAARYDAFPSMHVLATATLLAWDFRFYRARFWVMLLPALLMAVGTLYLRLHYFADLLASGMLFVVLQWCFRLKAASQTRSRA
ncbi:PAP2 superfamily protein [Roseimicrobium gellanilyticum]|uniref:PAP2 superfamily protein n=2 Tax=Roseimicrobium gellanilyticum TaxID=748857 RepID=A0A366HWZ3_9BACT|nr:PAP2 superfamily protein [Roseimicrobium gellanilyticum]